MSQPTSRSALILIVIAQFLGTSLWFAGNAAIPEISKILGEPELTASITTAVQLGFISGTLIFAILSIPDRFPPNKVFLYSSLLAAFFNLGITLLPLHLSNLLIGRFLVGFFLAGIYPVGMKIAADYFQKGLGSALGFLVGALVLGTAFPHLIRALDLQFSWKFIFWTTSVLASLGGILIGWKVPDGPFRKPSPKFDWGVIPRLSKLPALKGAASGYFGHMWELYTFWAFVPALVAYFSSQPTQTAFNAYLSFAIIGVGAISCGIGGLISVKKGSNTVALFSLVGSGICCLILWILPNSPDYLWIGFLLIWGMLVTADSPQFSTLVAQATPSEYKGTALTLVNCFGFSLTILSIQFAQFLQKWLELTQVLSLLFLGPAVGLLLFKIFKNKKEALSPSLPAS